MSSASTPFDSEHKYIRIVKRNGLGGVRVNYYVRFPFVCLVTKKKKTTDKVFRTLAEAIKWRNNNIHRCDTNAYL